MPDMARAGLLFPEAAPTTLLQPRQQPRVAPRPPRQPVTTQQLQRLLILLGLSANVPARRRKVNPIRHAVAGTAATF